MFTKLVNYSLLVASPALREEKFRAEYDESRFQKTLEVAFSAKGGMPIAVVEKSGAREAKPYKNSEG